MKAAYRSVAQLIMAAVVVQGMTIALGMFAVAHDVDNGRPFGRNSSDPLGLVVHGVVGEMIIPLLAVLLMALALVADVACGVKTALGVLLMVILQIALGFAALSVPLLGLLHGLGAFAVLWAAAAAARQARVRAGTGTDRAPGSATANAQP